MRTNLCTKGYIDTVCKYGMNLLSVHFQLPKQSVPITTKGVSSNPVHGKVYSIHSVIKFVSDLRQFGGIFSGYSCFIHQ